MSFICSQGKAVSQEKTAKIRISGVAGLEPDYIRKLKSKLKVRKYNSEWQQLSQISYDRKESLCISLHNGVRNFFLILFYF